MRAAAGVGAMGRRDRSRMKMSGRFSGQDPHPLRKLLVMGLAGFCLLGVATTPSRTASPCSRGDGVTLVCKRADRDLRIIHGTVSPSRRYGFAWGFSTGDWTDRTMDKDDRDGSYSASDQSGVENYLVRLSDSEILKRLAGSHFGDRLNYNRWQYRVHWSPNSAWVLEENGTLLINAYHIEQGDRVIGPFDFKSFGANPVAGKSLSLGTVKSVQDDGTIEATADGENEEFDVKIRLAVGPKPDTLEAKLISIDRRAR
jgi:hypothetical protein